MEANFDFSTIKAEVERLTTEQPRKTKADILKSLLEQVQPTDFTEMQYPNLSDEERKEKKVKLSEIRVLVLNNVLETAQANNWALCKQGGFCYLYNGAFWETLNESDLKRFLSDCAKAMGLKQTTASDYKFAKELYEQFLFSAHLQPPEYDNNTVLINLKNGTFCISTQKQELVPFSSADFLTYQLPFEYNEQAACPIFTHYLNRVLPDSTAQAVLAEYAGYLFIRHGSGLKFEKCLILYGGGANGKSVFFEVLTALLERENVSTYTLSELTDKTGYYRAEIASKLLNYASEISREMSTDLFKKLASGEAFTARSPYGKPFEVRSYAKFIFNANELPKDTEQTNAFFRRFIIVPFSITIPEAEQDKELHSKIINNELAGVFLWVLDGLKRLLSNKAFTECIAAAEALKQYQTESDSVQMFLNDKEYQPSSSEKQLLKDLYCEYKVYCCENGYRACSNRTFVDRLRKKQFTIHKSGDRYVYIEKSNK
jgi:putative DNA primase/helicase